jgi:hypothetical protein
VAFAHKFLADQEAFFVKLNETELKQNTTQ